MNITVKNAKTYMLRTNEVGSPGATGMNRLPVVWQGVLIGPDGSNFQVDFGYTSDINDPSKFYCQNYGGYTYKVGDDSTGHR